MAVIPNETVRRYADYQVDWKAYIEALPKRRHAIKSTEMLSIQGEAPKGYLMLGEVPPDEPQRGRKRRRVSNKEGRWPSYIAKLGSKWYPVESITEQILTRIGQVAGLRIASSQLRMVGSQVRFLSKYFLKPKETLYHGFDLFANHIGRDFADGIAKDRVEPDFYTYQTIGEAVLAQFPGQHEEIMAGLCEMIAFDALVGNKDRHPANWGIVVHLLDSRPPRFSPVFDTARGLFWNISEDELGRCRSDNQRLEKYVKNSAPLIGWHFAGAVSHFELVAGIVAETPESACYMRKYADPAIIGRTRLVLEQEFEHLLSPLRHEMILRCLVRRQELLREALGFAVGGEREHH